MYFIPFAFPSFTHLCLLRLLRQNNIGPKKHKIHKLFLFSLAIFLLFWVLCAFCGYISFASGALKIGHKMHKKHKKKFKYQSNMYFLSLVFPSFTFLCPLRLLRLKNIGHKMHKKHKNIFFQINPGCISVFEIWGLRNW